VVALAPCNLGFRGWCVGALAAGGGRGRNLVLLSNLLVITNFFVPDLG
jgi:hypothetical protein